MCTLFRFPKTLNAINKVNEVFKMQNISLPVESQKTVTEETRFDDGLKVQKNIFGEVIDQMHQNAPEIKNIFKITCQPFVLVMFTPENALI